MTAADPKQTLAPADTPGGRIGAWPESLKTAMSIIVASPQPMWIACGPGMTFFCNDACRQMLGNDGDSLLQGRPAQQVWGQTWNIIGPVAEKVSATGEPECVNDVRVLFGDLIQERFWSFAVSPLGGQAGLFCSCTDVTEKVVTARRLRTVSELAANAAGLNTSTVAEILARNQEDIPFALLYSADDARRGAVLEQAIGCVGNDGVFPFVAEVLNTGERRVVPVEQSLAGLPQGTREMVVLPLRHSAERPPTGVLVAGVNARRPLDDDHLGFLDLVARHVGSGSRGYVDRELWLQAEAALRDSERRFRQMIDALPAAIYTTDAEGRLTHFNPAAVKLSGRVPELGTDQWCITWKLFNPDGTPLPHEECPMASVLKGVPVTAGTEVIAERPDGTRFWFTPYPTPLRDAQGRIVGGINMLVDITDRKIASEALRRSEERFRGVFDSSAIGVAILGLGGKVLQANCAFCRITGYSEEELRRLDCDRLAHADDCAAMHRMIEQLIAGEVPTFVLEQRYFTKQGQTIWVQNSFSLMRDAQGRPEHLVALCEEITERRQIELALRDNEERFRAIVETSPECVKLIDADGLLLQMNSSGLAMVGAETADEVIGKCIYDLIAPEFRAAFREFNERICRGDKGTIEFDIVGLRGERRQMETHAAPLYMPDRRTVHLAITRDITERRLAERASLLLAAIVDSSDDAIVSKDLNGVITSWNKAAETLFGYTAAEVVGRSITIIIPADRLSEEPQILSRLQRGERVDHFETIRRRKDGSLLDISLTISPVRNRSGKIIGASKIARNITDRKRAEAALRASEAKFRQLADSMPQMVWTARPDGYLDYYNERWYEFTGFARDAFGDMSWQPILHPDDVNRCIDVWYESVKTGQPFGMEYRLRDRHENRWRWFMGRALPVRDEDGNIVKWFGTCTDIDEQKRVEDELRRANGDLEQFAWSASHDLQEPLRGLRIYSELLGRRYSDKLDGQAGEFLGYLRDGATRMEMLVRDLLAYTRVTRLEPPESDADANESLREALANLSGAIAESGARVTSDPLPAVRMHATHLNQLFQNLVGNAIKYRDPQRIATVHISAKRRDAEWVFSVADNGIGVEPEYKERIFGIFKRLHTGQQYSGTGIGLAICQRIVDRYHGRIWVESAPGEGSVFLFSCPV